MTLKEIEALTLRMLQNLNLFKLPINVLKFAELIGVKVKMNDFGDDVSGFLVTKNNQNLIGINPSESKQRQRFTIAHELGHFMLHAQNRNKDLMFISKVHFRDNNSTTGENQKEIEANAFAAALLMPKPILQLELDNLPNNISEEEAITILAKRFQVSSIAMTYRIERLGLFN